MRNYNFIYNKLVQADDDLIGLIAYGLYKKDKVNFICAIEIQNKKNGIETPEVSEVELTAFHINSCTPNVIARYRENAETILLKLFQEVTNDEITAYQDEMLRNYQTAIRNEVTPLVPKTKTVIWQSCLGAFVFSLIASGFFFLGEFTQKGTKDSVQDLISIVKDMVQSKDEASLPVDSIK